MALIKPGTPFSINTEFSLKPNETARLAPATEDFTVTNGGVVSRNTREGKEENMARLTLRVKRAMESSGDSISLLPGMTKSWGGFKIKLVSVQHPGGNVTLVVSRN
jgi:hypothetical protein